MVNRNQFREIYCLFDQDVVIEIIKIFIEEYPLKLEGLLTNIEDRDLQTLSFAIHNLKGVISNFSAPETFELIKNFEDTVLHLTTSKTGQFEISALKAQLAEIKESVIAVADDLEEIMHDMLGGKFNFHPNG
ncbi:MAG: Hpt domain-containing protein [Lentimicrobiaceae bacterium]|nr:Hpt domain-containing protein [Lentimicrobiaceae bacterium]